MEGTPQNPRSMRNFVRHEAKRLAPSRSFMVAALAGTIWALSGLFSWSAETILIRTNAVWKYLDNGSDQGVAWSNPGFDDSLWLSGPAQFGYGDGDESTVVNCGSALCNSNNFVTTYFRRTFNVPNAAAYASLRLSLL